MTPEISELVRELEEFQANEPGFPQIFTRAAATLRRLSELSDDRVSRKEMLEAMREQRINLGGLHDKTLAELKRVREVAAEEINRLEGEVRSLRIDNARLRDEATIRSLVAGSTEGGK